MAQPYQVFPRGPAPCGEQVKIKAERPDLARRARITVVLKSRSSARQRAEAITRMAKQLPYQRRYLSCDELEQRHGARAESAAVVSAFAAKYQLEVVETNLARRSVVLAAPLATLERAFEVKFVDCAHPHGNYRSVEGNARIPTELAPHVSAVLGLDQRPLMRQHHPATALVPTHSAVAPAHKKMDPREMARLYGFPKFTGKGQTVGVIVLGGGFYGQDVQQYLAAHGAARPVTVKEVGGGKNHPASAELIRRCLKTIGMEQIHAAVRTVAQAKGIDSHGPARFTARQIAEFKWTLEATMDVEVLGALAPGANLVVYIAPNTEQGKFEALTHSICEPGGPSVISCSWGNEETGFTTAWMGLADELFQMAALAGITLCYSSGDDGDGTRDGGPPCAHFPASSPHVLACGGTQVKLREGKLRESVWSEYLANQLLESGGGVSRFFSQPHWQAPAKVGSATRGSGGPKKGRGLPDVAAKADFAPGYDTRVCGLDLPLGGGTSAAAPLWAALVARLNEGLGTRCGHLTPLLYRKSFRGTTHDVVKGSNGEYQARRGWDACTGWGSPRGDRLLAALGGPQELTQR